MKDIDVCQPSLDVLTSIMEGGRDRLCTDLTALWRCYDFSPMLKGNYCLASKRCENLQVSRGNKTSTD